MNRIENIRHTVSLVTAQTICNKTFSGLLSYFKIPLQKHQIWREASLASIY